MRADSSDAFQRVVDAIPAEVGGATLHPDMVRLWPGMDATEATVPLLERAGEALGRPVIGMPRGGASDASHFAASIPLTVDGLGPRGGAAHNPEEYIVADSLESRAAVALALASAALSLGLVTASDSSSRGRSSTISSARGCRRGGSRRRAPFLKSTRPPVRSWTTWLNDGSWPTTSTRASSSWRRTSSSASSRSKPSPSTSSYLGLDAERLGRQPGGVGRAHASGSCRSPRTRRRAAPAPCRPPPTGARRGRSARGRRRRPSSRAARPRRAGGARAAAPWRGA